MAKASASGAGAGKSGSNQMARASINNPMSIDSGNTLRRYRAPKKMSQDEINDMYKAAKDSGTWLPS